MASGLRRPSLSLFQQDISKFQATKSSDASKMGKEVEYMMNNNSGGWPENIVVMMEIRKKIVTLRDIIDLPPCDDSGPIHELMVGTVEDLHKLYPNAVPRMPIKGTEIDEGLVHLYNALKSIGDSWAKSHKWVAKFGHNADEKLENDSLEQLAGRVLAKLNYMIKLAKEMFDVMDEDEKNEGRIQEDSAFGDILTESYSDIKNTCPSPVSPTYSPPELIKLNQYADVCHYQPLLMPLRLQAVEKCLTFHMFPSAQSPVATNKGRAIYEPNDEIREENKIKESPDIVASDEAKDYELSQNMPKNANPKQLIETIKPEAALPPPSPPSNQPPPPSAKNKKRRAVYKTNEEIQEKDKVNESPATEAFVKPKDSEPPKDMPKVSNSNSKQLLETINPAAAEPPPLPPPPPSNQSQPAVAGTSPSSNMVLKTATLPPPPPILYLNGSVPAPVQLIPTAKEAAPPPPPPLGASKSLLPKKANTKLKRSAHMGNLYRVLKGKVEGSNLNGKKSRGRRTQVGESAGGKQGMADALAEMTKRSAYFQQIEEDVEKHAKSILDIKGAISSFRTNDMAELLKFHKYVEQLLEELTDETQVLARFEDFPSKKLESLRTAAALYKRLEKMVSDLKNWKVEPPLSQLLEKVECHFNKIKGEIEGLERSKDEESKRFQSHNIHFDFHILVRIKEHMVDVSSSCMELALREQRGAKTAANAELGLKNEGKQKECIKMLWKAFQLAFRIYSFAGGQDDRADRLTKELAQEIETAPHNE
ncbi:hypothetical protein U1Q18_024612 [Sarracenia purpurea var. burkii]